MAEIIGDYAVSDTDSFIDEVSEEVRRDQLYKTFRKYGWIAVVGVVLIVGGASYNEFRKAKIQSVAQATGDALLSALDEDDAANRATALENATLEAPQAEIVRKLLLSSENLNAGDRDAAAAALSGTVADSSPIYQDLANLKALLIAGDSLSAEERRAGLEALASPGAPFALIASEQIALMDVEAGKLEAAIERLQGLILDAESTEPLRQRASQLIVALGGEPETLPSLPTAQ